MGHLGKKSNFALKDLRKWMWTAAAYQRIHRCQRTEEKKKESMYIISVELTIKLNGAY